MLQSDAVETKIITDFMGELGRRPTGQEIYDYTNQLFRFHSSKNASKRILQIILRMGIKSMPLKSSADNDIALLRKLTQHRTHDEMPGLIKIVAQCGEKNVPVPLIFSCRKYLGKALNLARSLKPHYFDIHPIIIIGSLEIQAEVFDQGVLCIPVNDDYESLPYKVFEAYTFFEALEHVHGIIKIDDDVVVRSHIPINIDDVRSSFKEADYMGDVPRNINFDRLWHFGKCTAHISPFYSKPFVAAWATGALYYLSKRSLSHLATHYLKYPGTLQGEIYEDKSVCDVLYKYGIQAEHNSLQKILNLSIDISG